MVHVGATIGRPRGCMLRICRKPMRKRNILLRRAGNAREEALTAVEVLAQAILDLSKGTQEQ